MRDVETDWLFGGARRVQLAVGILLVSLTVMALMPSAVLGPFRLPTVVGAGDPVIAAAGDVACDPSSGSFNGGNGSSSSCRQRYTSDLLVNGNYAAVLALGDNQYYCGGYSAYLQSYDLSWGRVKAETHPAVGNHEYLTSGGTGCDSTNTGAAGYFNYFGAAAGQPGQGYYSFDIGAWHLIALNSNCSSAGGCGTGSPQYNWLKADLLAHPVACTLAFWHIPLYSSGGRAAPNMKTLWQVLYDNNADLILEGHDHTYERFAPQDANANLDPARGLRSFIVGTGGANHTSFATIAANSEVRNASTFGVLAVALHPTSYDWQFIPEAGKTFTDSGTTACHGSSQSSDTTPPSTPTGLTATSVSASSVSLGWTASTDNVGVTSYTILRNGSVIGTSTTTSFTDNSVSPSTSYTYTVKAYDAAGNASAQSSPLTVTTTSSGSVPIPSGSAPIPSGSVPILTDDFESGTLTGWTNTGMVNQSQVVYAGSWAARATTTSAAAWGWHGLSSTQTNFYYRIRFKIVSQGANNMYLLKERTSTGTSIMGLYLGDGGNTLNYRNDAGGVSVRSTRTAAAGVWHELQVHLVINGTAGQIETWLDGTKVPELSKTDNFGTVPVGRVQIADNSGARAYDLVIDDLVVDTHFI